MIRRSLLAVVPLLFLIAACGDDDGAGTTSASSSASGAVAKDCEVVNGVDTADDSQVHVTLDEYSIDIQEDSTPAGVVKVEATNSGDVAHELVVLKGPKSAVKLQDDGSVDEGTLVGEIEPFAAGGECQANFDLAAGTYTLVCAIVEESGVSHYSQGMVAELDVK